MSTEREFNLETFLSTQSVDSDNSVESEFGGTAAAIGVPWKESGYTGEIDYRIRQLSYSSGLLLQECPRKFELYKKRASKEEPSLKSQITFNFGDAIGDAIQLHFQGKTKQQIIWHLFLNWKVDLFAFDEKGMKSFWLALVGVERFLSLREEGFLSEYELVEFEGKPACELSFKIDLQDGFNYRGHVDLVLRHKFNHKIVVLECKTTGFDSVNPSSYKNSAQAIGYSVVVDYIAPTVSAYQVIYLVYTSKSREFHTFQFEKSYSSRAGWIQDIAMQKEFIQIFEGANRYPLHGQSCVSKWGYECEYIQVCTLHTDNLVRPCTAEAEDKTEYQFKLTLEDLIQAQFRKMED